MGNLQMKENRSLQLSLEMKSIMQQDLAGIFYNYFPFDKLNDLKNPKSRDRVFNEPNTLLTMVLTMTQEDKSLQNSVNIYGMIHDKNIERLRNKELEFKDTLKTNVKPRKGRPKLNQLKIQKSKTREVSRNTSAYTQARQRINLELMDTVFLESTKTPVTGHQSKFYGKDVYITDGTYLQLQDTESIKQKFNNSTMHSYPRGLLQVIIAQGTGLVSDYSIDSDKKGELELFGKLIGNMKPNSLLLADALYNCFAIFSLLKRQGVDVIVPGKRIRKYTVLEKNSAGDEIVRIPNAPGKSKTYKMFKLKDKYLDLRRIETKNPENEEENIILYTSLLDKKIHKEEIFLKYFSRWDIEISIREIKAIMGLNVIRGRTHDMVLKELKAGLIAYNFIRKIIIESALESAFPPETDIIQAFYEIDKPVLMDKLGRIYNRWSPGRLGFIDN